MDMDVRAFVNCEYEQRDDFARRWIEQNKADPSNYPSRMGRGDWDKQFKSFPDCSCE